MGRKANIICIILTIIIAIGFGYYKHYSDIKNAEAESQLAEIRKQYEAEKEAEANELAEKEARFENIREDIPGIVCWGDDMTYGRGGVETSYPHILEDLLTENGYSIPVYNFGISGEDSLTVFGRMGAIPFVVDEFKLDENATLYEVKVTSSYNNKEVNPLMQKRNPGVNPSSIMGIDGTLYGWVEPADLSKLGAFFFGRTYTGDAVVVPKGTEIVTNGTTYKDYIHIVAVGENGGWDENIYNLVEQHRLFVEYLEGSKNADSYIILGMIKGNADENHETELLMSENFGEHYVNLREYLAGDAMNDLGLVPTDRDREMMAEGIVPESLMADENNLNDDGYKAVGQLVYDRLTELGYVRK